MTFFTIENDEAWFYIKFWNFKFLIIFKLFFDLLLIKFNLVENNKSIYLLNYQLLLIFL